VTRPFAFALALVAVLLPSIARADAPLTGNAKSDDDLGRVLFAKGDYPGALAKFELAHQLATEPRILWNMAACHRKMGHFAKAITLVDEYVVAAAATLGDEDRREAVKTRDALRTHVASVTIATAPDGASIVVDGEAVGTTPLAAPILVDEGPHVVRYARQGFRSVTRTERVTGGTDATWRADLERLRVRLVTEQSGGRP
jgi:PEGA domain